MKKPRFDTYNDGFIEYGDYIESYGQDGNALNEKEFIRKGKLFFSYQSIREQDKLKYDNTGLKVAIKLKTRYVNTLKSSDIIRFDNSLYSVAYVEPDNKKQNLYIFLTDLVNELDKHISIYVKKKNGALEDDTWELYKIVWSKVYSLGYKSEKESVEANKLTPGIYKNVVIRYLEVLDLAINTKATIDYKIEYKNKFYDILQIVNVDEMDELLDISIKGE